MTARLFGLAEINEETEEPDPERVRFWGMKVPDGAVVYWREPDRSNQFAVFASPEDAEERFGRLFDLGLLWQ